MSRRTILQLCLTTASAALAGMVTAQSAPSEREIPYATLHTILSSDTPAQRAEKAAKVLPRPNQTRWMRLEETFFIHFGPNTFRGVEWGTGQEDPSVFNPTALDAEQWMRAIKNAGGKLAILVCKHHDGFCLWPSRYTNHSVAASPWLKGKGNEVAMVARAAKKYGIKLGVYLSPADLFQLRTNPKFPGGYYGNESPKLRSRIPTDPASFKSNPESLRLAPAGSPTFTYNVDDYNRYFLNQLYELLTEYGPIDEVWFDGANPDPSVKESYDYAAWYDLIRRLQPNATIAVKGPDVRWVGNEGGVGRTTEWSVVPLTDHPDKFTWPDMQNSDLGSRALLKDGASLWWYPAETNMPILSGWFWSPTKTVRSGSELIDYYYQSIGRNGNALLNLSPDTRGLIPDNQIKPLEQMADYVRQTFRQNLAKGARLTADSSTAGHAPSQMRDGNPDTWWEASAGSRTGTITLDFPRPVTFDVVLLQEAIDHRGQRIESFTVEVKQNDGWQPVDTQTTVGRKRLLRLPTPYTATSVRIRINGARYTPTLAEIGLYKQAITGLPPAISERGRVGIVKLTNSFGYKMVYTTDGTTPTAKSKVYVDVIPMKSGGTLQAACLLPNGRVGSVATKVFAGLVPEGWKILSVDSEETAGGDNGAANAIDGDNSKFWHTRWYQDQTLPHAIAVDMGKVTRINGFTYLPRQDGNPNGTIQKYRFEVSLEGTTWSTAATGAFDNIKNNPTVQMVRFPTADARYFRLTALTEVNGTGWTSAAEISVLADDPKR